MEWTPKTSSLHWFSAMLLQHLRHWLGDFSTAPPGLVRFELRSWWPAVAGAAMPSGPEKMSSKRRPWPHACSGCDLFFTSNLGVRFWKNMVVKKDWTGRSKFKNQILANELLSCYFWLLFPFLRKAQLNCYLRHLDLQRSPLPSTANAKRNSVCSSKRDLGGQRQFWTVKGRIIPLVN